MPTRAGDETVQMPGWNKVIRALKQADPAIGKQVAAETQRIGQTYFVPEARRRAASRTNPRPGQRVINSIGAARVQSGVVVTAGGRRAPEFYGHEFGSLGRRSTGKPKGHTTQFPVRSGRLGRGSAGYFFFPAVRATGAKTRAAFNDLIGDTLDSIAKEAG